MAGRKSVLEDINTSLDGLVQLASWQMALARDVREEVHGLVSEASKPGGRKKRASRPAEAAMIKRQILPPRKRTRK